MFEWRKALIHTASCRLFVQLGKRDMDGGGACFAPVGRHEPLRERSLHVILNWQLRPPPAATAAENSRCASNVLTFTLRFFAEPRELLETSNRTVGPGWWSNSSLIQASAPAFGS